MDSYTLFGHDSWLTMTVNQLVVGSIPTAGAKKYHKIRDVRVYFPLGDVSFSFWGNIWGNMEATDTIVQKMIPERYLLAHAVYMQTCAPHRIGCVDCRPDR